MSTPTSTLRARLTIETKTCFPLRDGRELLLRRGVVAAQVSFRRIDRESVSKDWDVVACTLTVADHRGRLFQTERSIGANWFLELLRTSRMDSVGEPTLLLGGLRCYYDHRVWIPTVGRSGDDLVAMAYWAKQLDTTIDVLTYHLAEWDHLLIRVHAIPYGSLGYRPAPLITVASDWAAKVVLWPTMLSDADGPLGDQLLFQEAAGQDRPQALVEVV